MFSRNIQR